MTLATGTRLGPYEIQSAIGAGGMGEVYRARDTRLDRNVAIKVVSERLTGDPTALARLEREARAVAVLSHPNILAVHDFGRADGVTYVVMELLEGEPLDRRLASEQLSWRAALEIAASLADGLASAHAKGIFHRDLKPANIFVTRDGVVKILDFGLAKQDPFRSDVSSAGTVDAAATEPSALLGTVGYMSPEQVRGETLDQRTDIFSLGCVLYEMLTGRKAFHGGTPAETLAAILRDPPDQIKDSGKKIPPRLEPLVRRCLEKNPDHRFQSARDLAFALREILADGLSQSSTGHAPVGAIRRSRAIAAGLGVLLVAAAVIVWVDGRVPSMLMRSSVPRIRSLAVLPLTNLSSDREQEYFADAMTEELTARLAKLGSWRVTSRTSVMGYRGTQKKIPEIAKELDVDALIEGSVTRDGSRVKVTAQLIDGRTDRHLWADTFERELESVMAIQDDVARAIAAEVDVKLTPEGSALLTASSRRVLPAAYDAYIRGRHAWDKRGESDLHDAIRFFQQSIDADPTYAPAYAGLADCYGQLGYGSFISPDDAFPRAGAAAKKALDLDPTLAEAHASLGYALMYYDWNFAEAEAEFKRAFALNPNYALAHQWYAYLLTAMERPEAEAEGEIATARKLDPLSVPINIDLAYMLHYYSRNDEALKSIRLALEMNPKYAPAYFWLARIYTSQRRYQDAEAALQNIGPLRTWTPAMAVRGYLYAKEGRPREAKDVLSAFDALTRQGRYASSYAIAVIHAGLGDRERAFSSLEDAYRERSHWLVWLRRDPRWDEIRSDARFRNLVKKVGLSAQ
jgi:serine/threonine protein kinase/tetratricopeptide (TPR) repeat protein